ncbi:hypothetical protein ACFL2C_02080 [Patescibacteria group bacterium]
MSSARIEHSLSKDPCIGCSSFVDEDCEFHPVVRQNMLSGAVCRVATTENGDPAVTSRATGFHERRQIQLTVRTVRPLVEV